MTSIALSLSLCYLPSTFEQWSIVAEIQRTMAVAELGYPFQTSFLSLAYVSNSLSLENPLDTRSMSYSFRLCTAHYKHPDSCPSHK